jgi:Fe-S oxidoreductase
MGYDVLELQNNKEETLCCGSCGTLSITNPQLAEKIALDFIKKLLKMKVKKIVTADPQAYNHLKNIMAQSGIRGIDLLEISELICDSFGIKKAKHEDSEQNKEIKSINQREQEQAAEILKQAE